MLEANKLSLKDDSGPRTNELHEFLSHGVSASCRGTLKEGNFTVLCQCNGAVSKKREKFRHIWGPLSL